MNLQFYNVCIYNNKEIKNKERCIKQIILSNYNYSYIYLSILILFTFFNLFTYYTF